MDIKNVENFLIYKVVSKMEITADDGKNYNTEVYNLDAIRANADKEHMGLEKRY